MHVIATAGHVDHGKSTLVRALTGMEPDRWAEERRRGMTIDLGYVWTDLPSGRTVAFVDVPGHARFVPNMLAGVGPVPAALVVVAADEGWRQQSAEHLAALDALQVRHGLLAITRSDLADPAPAIADARARLAATSLGECEAVAVSGVTGVGLPELRDALDRLVARLPRPDVEADVRLWVDRAFTIRGAGTVVTGTLAAGTLRVGDELLLAPEGRPVRVRGLQSLKRTADAVPAVARVAVNLRGIDRELVQRGDALVTPGAWLTTDELDVRLTAPADLLPAEPILHVGSAALAARVRPLGGDTARLRLAARLPLRPGDRALLRDPGRHLVAAGVTVLDVRPPRLARRGSAARRAEELATAQGAPDADTEVARRGVLTAGELRALGIRGEPGRAVAVGDWRVAPTVWAGWRERARETVAERHRSRPLEGGVPLDELRQGLGVPDRALVEALVAAEDDLVVDAGRVRSRSAGPALPPDVERALEPVRRRLEREPFAAPEAPELAAAGLDARRLAAAVRAGRLVRVGEVYLLPGAEREAVRRLAALPQPFTASEARRALDTTRRVAIPLLEHLDGMRLTRRVDAQRREVVAR